MSAAPRCAMVLAAGLGKRMRPLADDRPKPLVEVAGKALLDHTLDRLANAGVERAVVNLHYKGEMIRDHIGARSVPEVRFSDESDALLETGGGVAHALDMLGAEPFLVVNGDVLWLDGPENTIALLGQRWNDETMDALLLATPTVGAIGYDAPGDYFMDAKGGLRRRRAGQVAPFLFAGIQILHPRLFDDAPEGAFSLNLLYDRAEEQDRLHGQRHEGLWAHVGTPDSVSEAEAAFGGGAERTC